MSGIWLGIDTTTTLGSVALTSQENLISEIVLPVTGFHSEKLLPAIEQLLSGAKISGEELAGIAVSLGPGSYTGLRIGLASATGLSAGWGVPLKGISSLRVLAATLPDAPALSCVRARNKEVFAGAFSSSSPFSEEIIKQSLYSTQELEKKIRETNITFSAIGSGRSEVDIPELNWVSSILDYPRASIVAECAMQLAEKKGFDSQIEPLYLREFNQRVL